jgi:hypothetical protein
MMAFRTLSNRFAPFKAGMLAPIYGWFTEGFDTRDLKEAKALLESWRDEDAQEDRLGRLLS